MTKLGNHTVGLRKRQTRLDENGQPARDEFGDELLDTIDVEVRWCLVTPTRLTGQNDEPENRTAPTISGMTWLAPAGTDVESNDLAVWPITEKQTVDGALHLSGQLWQVIGDPAPWPESVEVHLRKAT